MNKESFKEILSEFELNDFERKQFNAFLKEPENSIKDENIDFVFPYGKFDNELFYLPFYKSSNRILFGKESGSTHRYIENFIGCLSNIKDCKFIMFDDLSIGKSLSNLYEYSEKKFLNKDSVYDIYDFSKRLDLLLKSILSNEFKDNLAIIVNFNSDVKFFEKIEDVTNKILSCISTYTLGKVYFIYVHNNFQYKELPNLSEFDTNFLRPYLTFNNNFTPILHIEKVSDSISESMNEDDISILIGKDEYNKDFYFNFGEISENYHGVIGGQSGKGKSVLLNTLIINGVLKYKRDELRFMLIDCKGSEFVDFHDIDNPQIMSLKSSSQIDDLIPSIKQIEDLRTEREKIFQEHKCRNINQYNKLFPNEKMPRIIIIIDEYQQLFSGKISDSTYVEKILIQYIVKQGRSFGIHLLISTQTLGDGVSSKILNNFPLRIALGMTSEQSEAFLRFKNNKANGLPKGKAIYNSKNGELDHNCLISVNYYNEEEIKDIIATDNE